MEAFGPFEVGRILDSANGASVYEARKQGDPKGKYVVKVFSPEQFLSEEQTEERAALSSLFHQLTDAFGGRVELQKQAGQGSPDFAPILAAGQDARGAWYATQFYPRSVKGMLERFVALEAPDLFHVVHSTVRAALHLKKVSGRSHGNLKTSNIFIEGVRRPRNSRVLVADPLPGDAAEAERYELADLRAIGELIYQLVVKKKVDFGWVIVPLESSADWVKLFGKKTPGWLALCNKLLDKSLTLGETTLEQVEHELRRLEPKPAVPLVPVAIGAGIVGIAAVAAFFLLHKRNTGELVIKTDPPGSRVSIIALDQDRNEDLAHSVTNTTAMNGTLKARVDPGLYKIKVEYKSLFGDLPSPHSIQLEIQAGATIRTNFTLPYGGLVVRSEPPGARFELHGQTVQTPFTNRYLQPADVEFKLNLVGFETTNFSRSIPSNHALVDVTTQLRRPPPGSELVEFASEPPGADIFVDGVKRGKAGDRLSLDIGPHEISAELPPWFARQARQFTVQKGQNPIQDFRFAHGVFSVVTSSPPVLDIYLNNQLAGHSPTNLNLPPGTYVVRFQADGYETNGPLNLVVADGATNAPTVELKPLAGFVFLASEPPGAQVFAAGQLLTNTPSGMARVPLPPGTNSLTIAFTNLDPVWRTNIVVKSGQSNQLGTFRFQYATVVFTNARPQEVPAEFMLHTDGRAPIRFGDLVYQRPGASLTYRADLENYDPWTVQVSLTQQTVTNIPVRLLRRKVPVALHSNLEGTTYSYIDEEQNSIELGAGTNFSVTWGTNIVLARLSNLQPLRHTLVVPRSGAVNDTFQFNDYGLVITTNLAPGTDIQQTEGSTTLHLGRAPAPFYSRPGNVKFLLASGGAPIELATNVTLAGFIILARPMPPIISPATGLEFYWVPGLPGTVSGAYVGRTEVTQEEYDRVMQNNTSEPKDPKLPVNNLDAKDAETFCTRLNEQDKTTTWAAKGFRYALPTVAQWDYLTNAANPGLGVFSASSSSPLARPSPPASKPADGNGLYDLYGNVWEICRGNGQTDYRIRGGCFNISSVALRILMRQSQDHFDGANFYTGFRVVAVPTGP